MRIVQLNENHTRLLVELETECTQSQFIPLSLYEWYEMITSGTKVWGIIIDNQLIASASITFYDHKGDQVDQMSSHRAVLTNSVVHPMYRGRGYQIILIRHRIEFLLKNTTVKEINSLVKKSNIYSIRNLESEGFVYEGKHSSLKDIDGYKYTGSRNFWYWKIMNFLKSL